MFDFFQIARCLSPRTYIDVHGDKRVTDCGKCLMCILRKSSKMTALCHNESTAHKYTNFVTLTYTNKFIPKAHVLEYNDIFETKLPSGQLIKYPSDTKQYIIYDADTAELLSDKPLFIPSKVLDNCKRITSLSTADPLPFDVIPYLRYADIQLFLKRLRKLIYKHHHETIRYYVVGEYGPKTLRPHWHLLLFHNSQQLTKNIQSFVSACWQYGNTDTSLSRGGSQSYVAGYVNSMVTLPNFYQACSIKPVSKHSNFFGTAFTTSFVETIYELERDAISKHFTTYFAQISNVINMQDKCRILPTLPKSYLMDHHTRGSYFKLWQRIVQTYKTDNVRELATIFYRVHCDNYLSLYEMQDIHLDISNDDIVKFYPPGTLLHDVLRLFNVMFPDEVLTEDKIIDKYCRFLYPIKYFHTIICKGDSTLYYDRYEKYLLIEQLIEQQKLKSLYTEQEVISEFDDLLLAGGSFHDILPYYYQNPPSLTLYSQLPIFKILRSKTENEINAKTKHKFLNDLLGVLINS